MLPRSGQRLLHGGRIACGDDPSTSLFVSQAQRWKPSIKSGVFAHVDKIEPRREAMVNASERRFVKVAPPTVHAGIGSALRHAFAMEDERRTLSDFEELLSKLD